MKEMSPQQESNLWPPKHQAGTLSTWHTETSLRARPLTRFIFDTCPAYCKDQQCRRRTVWWKKWKMVNFKLGETNVKMKINNQHVTSVGKRKNLSPWRDWTYDLPNTVRALYPLDLQRTHVEWGHILGSYFTHILHTSGITNEQVAGTN